MNFVGSIDKVYLTGIIYDVIVEPPSVGSTTDEFGHSKPVSFSLCTDKKSYNFYAALIGSFSVLVGILILAFTSFVNKEDPMTQTTHQMYMYFC